MYDFVLEFNKNFRADSYSPVGLKPDGYFTPV